jgi:hypothetical protein
VKRRRVERGDETDDDNTQRSEIATHVGTLVAEVSKPVAF